MGLDINTPRGQLTLAEEREAVAIFHRHYPELLYCHTPKDESGDVDGLVIGRREPALVLIAQASCRKMTLQTFETTFKRKWLVTLDKLIKGHNLAAACRVPFWGLLYLVPDKSLLIQPLWTPRNNWEVEMSICKTETQATVNGGRAVRDNAYVNMVGAEPLTLMSEVVHK